MLNLNGNESFRITWKIWKIGDALTSHVPENIQNGWCLCQGTWLLLERAWRGVVLRSVQQAVPESGLYTYIFAHLVEICNIYVGRFPSKWHISSHCRVVLRCGPRQVTHVWLTILTETSMKSKVLELPWIHPGIKGEQSRSNMFSRGPEGPTRYYCWYDVS